MSDPLYQQTSVNVEVVKWKRAKTVTISNPLNGTPTVLFMEEIATTIGDDPAIVIPSTQLGYAIKDPTISFPSKDVSNDQDITRTFAQLQADITAAYLYLAQLRDQDTNPV